jgi:pimeloyl-CoA synthetase
LWVSLPKDLQAKLISRELGQYDFLGIVRQTIKEYIKIYQQELSESARKKPAKKTEKKTKRQPLLPAKP